MKPLKNLRIKTLEQLKQAVADKRAVTISMPSYSIFKDRCFYGTSEQGCTCMRARDGGKNEQC